jgi:uncharacterized membrane protein
MDPNLFHLDWDRTFEALATIVVLAFIVERALALLFEHRWFVSRFRKKGVKEPIALILTFVVVQYLDFDALSIIVLRPETGIPGKVLTAAVIAGGSKGAIRLFHDLLEWKSSALKEAEALDAKP